MNETTKQSKAFDDIIKQYQEYNNVAPTAIETELGQSIMLIACLLFFIWIMYSFTKKNKRTTNNFASENQNNSIDEEVIYLGKLCKDLDLTPQDLLKISNIKKEQSQNT